jgi:hypothetical protein
VGAALDAIAAQESEVFAPQHFKVPGGAYSMNFTNATLSDTFFAPPVYPFCILQGDCVFKSE